MYSQPEGEGQPKKRPRKARPLSANVDTIRASGTVGEASHFVHPACRYPAALLTRRSCTPHLILECGHATSFARLSDRNPIEIHKPQQEACKSDFPVYKQADLCESVEVCSSGLAPTLQMCYFSCHLCAARGVKCHYSSSDVACNVCGVTCHSKAPQPA